MTLLSKSHTALLFSNLNIFNTRVLPISAKQTKPFVWCNHYLKYSVHVSVYRTELILGKQVITISKAWDFINYTLLFFFVNSYFGWLVLTLESLSTDVFEPRTSTGSFCSSFSTLSCLTNQLPSSHFSIYDSVLFSTKSELYRSKRRSFDFRLDVRGSKTSVLKLSIRKQTSWGCWQIQNDRYMSLRHYNFGD